MKQVVQAYGMMYAPPQQTVIPVVPSTVDKAKQESALIEAKIRNKMERKKSKESLSHNHLDMKRSQNRNQNR
jgi:ribosomal protein L9